MAVYRFRVFIEDDHEVYRDIELQGKQRFADLHAAVVKAFNFKVNQLSTSVDQSWYEGDSGLTWWKSRRGTKENPSHIFIHWRFLCITESYTSWVGVGVTEDSKGWSWCSPRCVRRRQRPYYTQPPPEPIVDEPRGGNSRDGNGYVWRRRSIWRGDWTH